MKERSLSPSPRCPRDPRDPKTPAPSLNEEWHIHEAPVCAPKEGGYHGQPQWFPGTQTWTGARPRAPPCQTTGGCKRGDMSSVFLRWGRFVLLSFLLPCGPAVYARTRTTEDQAEGPPPPGSSLGDMPGAGEASSRRLYGQYVPEDRFPNRTTDFAPDQFPVCVLVRTYHGHRVHLPGLLTSLFVAAEALHGVFVDVFLVNTEPGASSPSGSPFPDVLRQMKEAADRGEYGGDGRSSVTVLDAPPNLPWSPEAFGYEFTDWALQRILELGSSRCRWMMFTNGDNYYMPYLFTELEEYIYRGFDMIAFDFITHHFRLYTNVVHVKMRRGHVDLGAVLISRDVIQGAPEAVFLPGNDTGDKVARDFHFIKRMSRRIPPERTVLVHRVLFSHQ